jgi:hypothetical protein
MRAQTQIECDPVVWNRIESLITTVLTPAQKETHASAKNPPTFIWVPVAFHDVM